MADQPDNALVLARKVWERYDVGDRTIDRWVADTELGFPQPIVIKRRRYFRLREIEAWERAQAAKSRRTQAA